MTEPREEIQFDFSVNLHNKPVTAEPFFFRTDQYSKRPVVQICKSTEQKEVTKTLESFILLYVVPVQRKSPRGSAFIQEQYKMFSINKNIEIEKSSPRRHTATGVVKRAIQRVKY